MHKYRIMNQASNTLDADEEQIGWICQLKVYYLQIKTKTDVYKPYSPVATFIYFGHF